MCVILEMNQQQGGVLDGMCVTASRHAYGMCSMYCMYCMYVSACLLPAQAQSSFCSSNCSIVTLMFLLCVFESFIRTAECRFLRLRFMHVGIFPFPFFCSMPFFK